MRDQVGVVITNFRDVILTPQRPFLKNDPGKFSLLPGFKSSSSKIILPLFSLYQLVSGEELRLWYGEDLANHTETNNGGRVCCNVYALYNRMV